MNWMDWLIAAVLVLSALQAAAQGFVFELFSLAGTVLGYLMAAWGYHSAAVYLAPYLKNDVPEANQSVSVPRFEDMVARAQQSAVLILVY